MIFTIGAVPLDPDSLDKATLAEKLASEIKPLNQRVDLLVFPECSLTGFYPEKAGLLARETIGDFTNLFSNIARSLDTHVLAGAFRDFLGGITNQAVLFSPSGDEILTYNKAKLFPMSREDEFLLAGEAPAKFTLGGFSVSPKICYDLRFPNSFFDQTPEIDLFTVIANWPDLRKDHWESLLRARSIENEAFVLGLNRFGRDLHGHEYTTRPMLFDPLGVECTPIHENRSISLWQISERFNYRTVGSTIGKRRG